MCQQAHKPTSPQAAHLDKNAYPDSVNHVSPGAPKAPSHCTTSSRTSDNLENQQVAFGAVPRLQGKGNLKLQHWMDGC